MPNPNTDERQRPNEDGAEDRELQIPLDNLIELHDGVRELVIVHTVPPRNHQHTHDESDETSHDDDGLLEESFHAMIRHTDKKREDAEHKPCCYHRTNPPIHNYTPKRLFCQRFTTAQLVEPFK